MAETIPRRSGLLRFKADGSSNDTRWCKHAGQHCPPKHSEGMSPVAANVGLYGCYCALHLSAEGYEVWERECQQMGVAKKLDKKLLNFWELLKLSLMVSVIFAFFDTITRSSSMLQNVEILLQFCGGVWPAVSRIKKEGSCGTQDVLRHFPRSATSPNRGYMGVWKAMLRHLHILDVLKDASESFGPLGVW